MRKLWFLAVIGLLVGGGYAIASGITLSPETRVEWTDCPGDAGEVQKTVKAGPYLMRVTTEDVWMCWPGICDGGTGGEKFPAGMAMVIEIPSTVILTCKSSAGTGDVIMTRGQ